VRGWDQCGVGLRRMGHITSEGGVLILLYEQAPLKDLGDKYNKDSSRVTAHRKVCDEFKKKETSARNGIVYGECQFVQLPCECTGLVEEVFTGRVQTPITIKVTIVTKESGMDVSEKQEHIQFMVNKTFRVKTVSQLAKEKKKVLEVTHSGYDIYADYDSEGTL
jgi:hypothetical protein